MGETATFEEEDKQADCARCAQRWLNAKRNDAALACISNSDLWCRSAAAISCRTHRMHVVRASSSLPEAPGSR